MKTHCTDTECTQNVVQIFNLICVECLEWHIAICFVRYIIIFLLLLSTAASTSSSSSGRLKNVWQVSVRSAAQRICASVCVRWHSMYAVYVPTYDGTDVVVFELIVRAHIECVSEPTIDHVSV